MKIREVQSDLQLISVHELYPLADEACQRNMRLVQVHATTLPSQVELNYCFATPDQWLNLRLTVDPQETVPSISKIYPCVFLYENEIHDLFGVQFSGISIDYQGKLYRLKQQMPFAPENKASDSNAGKITAQQADAGAKKEEQP